MCLIMLDKEFEKKSPSSAVNNPLSATPGFDLKLLWWLGGQPSILRFIKELTTKS